MKKIWEFIKGNKWEILSIISTIISVILLIFNINERSNNKKYYSKGFDKGFRRASKEKDSEYKKKMSNISKVSRQKGRMEGMMKTMEKIKPLIDESESKGFERGYTDQGSENIRGSFYSRLQGIRIGHHYGKASVLLGMDEPDMNNPDQRFMAESYNTKIVKISPEESEKLLRENKFDKEDYMKRNERIVENIWKDFN